MVKKIRKLIHRNNCKNLVIITGQQKAGKSLIINLLSSFKGPINVKIDFSIDNIIQLLKNKFLNLTQFKNIFLILIDNIHLNSIQGRNLNLKKGEESSIWSSVDPNFYLKKIKEKFSKSKIKSSIKKQSEMYLALHNFIEFKEILSGLSIKTKIIYVRSNPIDQIYSLYKSKKFTTFGDRIDRSVSYMYKNKEIHTDICGHERKYLNLSRLGKILLLKYLYDKKDILSFSKKKHANVKTLIIKYEKIVTEPRKMTKKISFFLGKKTSYKTKNILKSKELKSRKKYLKNDQREKRKKFLLSAIKNKAELKLFSNILKLNNV